MTQQPIFGFTAPQDIHLELNNGTVILKAGSKVVRPNGDIIQTNADYSRLSTYSGSRKVMLFAIGGSINIMPIEQCFSGNTQPTVTTNYANWLDTSTTPITMKSTSDRGTTWAIGSGYSLPLCILTQDSTGFSSIDQIFNGVGYMGSSLFVLPGVEGFCPNGKDGFNNLFQTVRHNSLSVFTYTNYRPNGIAYFYSNGNNAFPLGLEIVDTLPNEEDMVAFKMYYSKQDNFIYWYNGSTVQKQVGSVAYAYAPSTYSPYTITSFEVVNPFAEVDFYDYLYASSKPLSQYANSPKFMDLYNNLCGMFSNAKTMEEWYNVVFNLKTASGYGLDIWGKILNQGRQFSYVENGTTEYVYLGGEQTVGGITYSAEYMEEMYRMVLFLKALTYITNCTLASLNNLLQYYFRDRIDPDNNQNVYVINYGTMEIRYVFQFYVSDIEKSIFTSDVMPKPTGVLANFEFVPYGEYFGFFVNGIADPEDQPYTPFNNKPFYR